MKLSAFIAGGLAGVAAVMLWQRNRKMMSAMAGTFGQQVKSRVNNMKGDAFGRMLNMSFSGGKDHSRREEASPLEDELKSIARMADSDGGHRRHSEDYADDRDRHRI